MSMEKYKNIKLKGEKIMNRNEDLNKLNEKENEKTTEQPETIVGNVVDCVKLNVRQEPKKDSKVITEIKVGSEVKIDMQEFEFSTEWLKVHVEPNIDGFCMKQFISIK